jgi:hypothetical protein
MRKWLAVPLAALFCAPLAPAAAAAAPPPRSPEAAQHDMKALGAWLQSINDAVASSDASLANLGSKMEALLGPGNDPAAMRANSTKMRGVIQEVRDQVRRSQAALAAIPPLDPSIARTSGMDVGKVLADVRNQMTEMLAYLDTCESLVAAVEKNDRDAILASAPKLIRSGALLLDGRALTYRNREAAVPANRSAHQVLGVTVNLYEAMSVALRAWIRARVDHQPREAADAQRTQFLALALDTDSTVRQGRAQAALEKSELVAETARAKDNQAVRDVDARAALVLANEERLFVIGDQLAVWLRGHAGMTGEQLAGQTRPELLMALSSVEEQVVAIGREQAGVLAGPGT